MKNTPLAYFRGYKDHRMDRKQVHKIETIIAITLAAIISGAERWYGIAEFGKMKKEWIAGKGDYVLSVKGNQGFLEDDIKEAFKEAKADDEYEAKVELGHGRIEHRTTKVIHDLDWVCSQPQRMEAIALHHHGFSVSG